MNKTLLIIVAFATSLVFSEPSTDFKGAAIGIIKQGNVQFLYGEGITENTIFEIGSITKTFTTLVLMDLIVRGEASLDDPAENYLPNVTIPEWSEKKITLGHLATHTSGLPRMPDNFCPKDSENPYQDYSVEQLYEFLNHHNLQKTPGEEFEYSNMGMGLLGHILSLKTDKSYEELIKERILKKLNMNQTAVSLTPKLKKHFIEGHYEGRPTKSWDMTESFVGAGGLRSSIKDMTQFLALNMGLLDSPLTNSAKACHKQRIPGVGLGWMIFESDHGDIVWHNGATGGFRAFLGSNCKTKKGVVILSSSSDDWPDRFGFNLLYSED